MIIHPMYGAEKTMAKERNEFLTVISQQTIWISWQEKSCPDLSCTTQKTEFNLEDDYKMWVILIAEQA